MIETPLALALAIARRWTDRMSTECPKISEIMIIADDARLAAYASCMLATRGAYLSVIEGPRMQRPDFKGEVIRNTNAAARSKARRFILAGLDDAAREALEPRFPLIRTSRVQTAADIDSLAVGVQTKAGTPLVWGRDRIGIGVLIALRANRTITFNDASSPPDQAPARSDHLVVCEEGDDLAQVIAANYAYAIGAGLHLIPEMPKADAEELLERFYGLYDDPHVSPNETLTTLRRELREHAGALPLPPGGSITFISDRVPYGFGFSEVPSTHLFRYPDLGISIIHGFAAEQAGSRGVQVATLVNPDTTPAPEIDAAVKVLAERRTFVRVYEGKSADVSTVADMIELFPFDLILIATHCGDVSGYRWTYEFVDSEGIPRTMVVDIAIGVGRTDDPKMLNVTQFSRFVSLDGVAWNDEEKKSKLYVGTAMKDFIERSRDYTTFPPVKKETVKRVVSSAALRMSDHDLIALPRSLANEGTPIIVNNACVSWHRLALTFIFGGARAYVGTLFPISTTEAEEVLTRALRKHYGKALPHAFWAAQRDVYGDTARRPYIVTGVYPQYIRCTAGDVPRHIALELSRGLRRWRDLLATTDPNDTERQKTIKRRIAFFERELEHFAVLVRDD